MHNLKVEAALSIFHGRLSNPIWSSGVAEKRTSRSLKAKSSGSVRCFFERHSIINLLHKYVLHYFCQRLLLRESNLLILLESMYINILVYTQIEVTLNLDTRN